MGLASGPHGAKAVFRRAFAKAFGDVASLAHAREGTGVARGRTLAVLDGNVLVMATPASVTTFDAYVRALTHALCGACAAAEHVVVVFDEPAHLTAAKQEEQARRDALRLAAAAAAASPATLREPCDDAYDAAALLAVADVHDLMRHRAARPRLHDALCVAVLARLAADPPTHAQWSLTFDGIDPRGAHRPTDAPRAPGIVTTHPDRWHWLLRRATPIGEGDLKLVDVCERVRALCRSERRDLRLAHVRLVLVVTVDTDAFMTELLARSRRCACDGEQGGDAGVRTLLCLREPPRKRARDGSGAGGGSGGHFACVDVHTLHDAVVAYLLAGGSGRAAAAEPVTPAAALRLLVASLALCGCDYVHVPGMRADLVLPVVRDLVQARPDLLRPLPLLSSPRATHPSVRTVRAVVEAYLVASAHSAASPQLRRAVARAADCTDAHVLRACWTCAYWDFDEHTNLEAWGFW